MTIKVEQFWKTAQINVMGYKDSKEYFILANNEVPPIIFNPRT